MNSVDAQNWDATFSRKHVASSRLQLQQPMSIVLRNTVCERSVNQYKCRSALGPRVSSYQDCIDAMIFGRLIFDEVWSIDNAGETMVRLIANQKLTGKIGRHKASNSMHTDDGQSWHPRLKSQKHSFDRERILRGRRPCIIPHSWSQPSQTWPAGMSTLACLPSSPEPTCHCS